MFLRNTANPVNMHADKWRLTLKHMKINLNLAIYLISVAEKCIQLHSIPITVVSDSKHHFFEILT